MKVTDAMVSRFLTWNLPDSVAVDECATMENFPHPRTGTCLLTAVEARAMLEHVLADEHLDRAEIVTGRHRDGTPIESSKGGENG